VFATGGNGAAGIGNGCDDKDAGHNVTITNGITKVIARKGGTEAGDVNAFPIGPGHDAQVGNVVFGGYTVFDGTSWSPDLMVSGKYGDVWLDISDGTWTLTPYEGKFTVNGSGKKVIFSPGVLQYNSYETTYKWRFADHQYDRNHNLVGTWFNHFGWGTWTGNSPNPTEYSNTLIRYKWNGGDFTKESELVNEDQRGYDWYTLSSDEWQYLIANHTYGAASVHGVNGVIVLPDNWNHGYFPLTGYNQWISTTYCDNIISATDWENTFEALGVVFLPAAGQCQGHEALMMNEKGFYWSSSHYNNFQQFAYDMGFDEQRVQSSVSEYKHYCLSVRLVQDE
jgi:hypothetical protein